MSSKREFVEGIKEGRVIAKRCIRCGRVQLGTIRFCQECGSQKFAVVSFEGSGTVITYTIITVPPTGFEKYTPYAWVVIKLDGADLNISGFMGGIKGPQDLPIGCRAEITGFDERGITIKRAG